MKKIIFILCFIPLIGFSQDFGNFKVEDFKKELEKGTVNNQWYEFKSGGGFYKYFNKTPIGIKNAISEIKTILLSNKLRIENPSMDSSYLSSLVKDIYDYEMLNITISNENSEITKTWDIERKQFLMLNLKSDKYSIVILKLDK